MHFFEALLEWCKYFIPLLRSERFHDREMLSDNGQKIKKLPERNEFWNQEMKITERPYHWNYSANGAIPNVENFLKLQSPTLNRQKLLKFARNRFMIRFQAEIFQNMNFGTVTMLYNENTNIPLNGGGYSPQQMDYARWNSLPANRLISRQRHWKTSAYL